MKLDSVPVVGKTSSYLDGQDISYGIVVFLIGLVAIFFVLSKLDISQSKVISFIFLTAPIWLPYFTFRIFFETYMVMIGKKFKIKNGQTVVEIILPPEVFKSPEAMEVVFNQTYAAATPDNLMQTYIDGKRPPTFSFEIVSTGGDVHLYAVLPEGLMDGFMNNMFAQYPGVELKKLAVDYTAELPNDLTDVSMMSFHFAKKKSQAIPIKTYIDFGLDKLPKEEEKLDPMTPMLEIFASIQSHERLWLQLLCTSHVEKEFANGHLKNTPTWEAEINEEISKMMQRDPKTKAGDAELEGMPRITTGERDTIEAMERNGGKYAYHVAGRWIYATVGEGKFNATIIPRVIRNISQTEMRNRNGLGIRWRTDFNYMKLSDPFGTKLPALKRQELKEYKLRKLTKHSGAMNDRALSTEELATLFHLPGQVAITPTLNRVNSAKSEAPSNLPI